MYANFFLFFIALVYGSNQVFHADTAKEMLEELEWSILSFPKRGKIEVNISSMLALSTKNFFKTVQLMYDYTYILFWYSYGHRMDLPTKATWLNFIKEIKRFGYGGHIFMVLKENFVKYMDEKLLADLLISNPDISETDKENLLLDAMTLYQYKFRSIWLKLGNSGKFDDLKPKFSYYRKLLCLGIYDSLDVAFNKMVRNFEKSTLLDRRNFHLLVRLLTNDRNENWGLRWVANHSDPYFILKFFLSRENYSVLFFPLLENLYYENNDRKSDFDKAFAVLRRMLDCKVNLKDNEPIFESDFKNPFPSHIMGDNELKLVISQIVVKLKNFCFKHIKY
jgi:hypothetical protein